MKTPITLLFILFFLIPKLTYGQAPDLGTTAGFAAFTAVGAFDALGASVVTGDVGTNVGAFTGFPPGVLIGSIHVADPISAQAAIDVASAYSDLVSIPCVTVLGVTLGSGQILTPDVYCTGAATTLNGDLILDAQGDPNAIFIFQMDGAFSTGVGANIVLINSAMLCNVYWQVNGVFQLGDLSNFQGTVIANGAIHLLEGASVLGRVLSTSGAIDLHNNVVTVSDSCSILVITCPSDVTIQCTESTLPANTGTVSVTDDCEPSPTIVYTDAITTSACPQTYSIARIWTVSDICGNVSECTQIIEVIDTTAPIIITGVIATCYSTAIEAEADAIAATSTMDNCSSTILYGASTVGTCNAMITVTATDECGNESSTIYTTRVDDSAPVITASGTTLSLGCNPSGMAIDSALGTATATDNCSVVTPSFTDGSVTGLCLFSQTRTFTAIDECGNLAIPVLRTVTWTIDTTIPVITATGTTLVLGCNPTGPEIDDALGSATAADNCGVGTPTSSDGPVTGEPCLLSQTRTFNVTDACGNPALSVSRTVTWTIDLEAPVITATGTTLLLGCNPSASAIDSALGTATAVDNCTVGTPIPTDGSVTGLCLVSQTRTFNVSDACGNPAIPVSRTVSWTLDTTIPVITATGTTLTLGCNPTGPEIDDALGSATAADNCGVGTPTSSDDPVTGEPCLLSQTRTFNVTDACGNPALSVSRTVTWSVNSTAPVISCPIVISPIECGSIPFFGIATATDECDLVVDITFVTDSIPGLCGQTYSLTRTWTATNECGNTAQCSRTISVEDNTPPSITCPVDVTVQCASLVPAANPTGIVTADNCGGTATVSFIGDVISNQTCLNRFTVMRTYRSTDECGNFVDCNQIITVFDNTPPTITCPANLTVQCADQVPLPNPTSVLTADNCGATVTVTFIGDVIANLICVNNFSVTRTYSATDGCGNTATCTQMITVLDNIPPVIIFNNPILEGVGDTLYVQCFGQDPNWNLPVFDINSVTTTDNCGGNVIVAFQEILQNEGNCSVDGYIILNQLTWTATDVCGNSSTAFIFLALIDTIPPVIHGIPNNVSVNCGDLPAPPTTVFAVDECLCACLILFEESIPVQGCQDGQVIIRTWTATDRCGNVSTASQNITLIDVDGPVIEILQPEIINVTDGTIFEYTCNEGGIPGFYDDLGAWSVASPVTCGGLPVITFNNEILFPNNCETAGYIEQQTFHWKAIDHCGNISTLHIIVRLVDHEAPVLFGVPDMACIGDPSLNEVEAVDNCGSSHVRYWDVSIPNPCGTGIAFRRMYEAYDDCGNISQDASILLPNDQVHLSMKFVNSDLANLFDEEVITINCANHNGRYTTFGPNDIEFQGACLFGVSVNFTERLLSTGDCSATGVVAEIVLKWEVSDICGNVDSLIINAIIIDESSPVFSAYKPEMTIGCNDKMPVLVATDNCGDVFMSIKDSIVSGPCAYEFTVLRTVIATDPCGNVAEAFQTIHVGDGSGPAIEGVISEVCDDLAIPVVTAYDACAGVFVDVLMAEDTLETSCRDGFVIQRIWSATGVCGHISQIIQIIIVGDTTPPVILIPSYSVIRKFLDMQPVLVYMSQIEIMDKLNALDDNSVFVEDDCDLQLIPEFTLHVDSMENCETAGYKERRTYTWAATDICGNSSSISFTVDIMDDLPPVLSNVPNDTTIVCAPLLLPALVSTDDISQPVSLVYSEILKAGEEAGVFIVTRTWTATDACGNITVVVQHIKWIPNSQLSCEIILPALIECNSHGVIVKSVVTGDFGPYTYEWQIVGEKCFIQSGQGTPEISIYVGWSNATIILTITDVFGCISTCTVTWNCQQTAGIDFSVFPNALIPLTDSDQSPLTSLMNEISDSKSFLKQINFWPNPASGTINLSFESTSDLPIHYTLTNFLGQVVLTEQSIARTGMNTQKIDVTNLVEGSYLIQVKTKKEIHSKVIVILR